MGISEKAAAAFVTGTAAKYGQTEITANGGHLRVHGRTIARKAVRGQRCIIIDHCGFHTQLTCNRLNAVLDLYAPYCKVFKQGSKLMLSTPHGDVPFERNMVVYKDVDWSTGKVFPVEIDKRGA